MATSADKDDRDDEKDDQADDEAEAEEKAESKPAEKKAADKKPADKKPAAKDDDDDEDDEEDEKPAAKPVAKSGARPAVPAKPGAKPAVAKRSAGARPGNKPKASAPPPKGSFGKSLILFVVVFGGLAAAFAFLGREDNQGPNKPKWTAGQVVDVEITLVKNDQKELSCASPDEIGGKHCQFEAQNKPWSKGDNADDKKILKPYTTTDRIQFAAAGVWSEPATAPDKVPATRFSLKCKFKVEGTLKKIDVRWDTAGPWYPNSEWYAGSVSDCKVVP